MPVPASSRGGSLPDPITEPVNVELAADAVGLSVTAAAGGSADLVQLTPDDPADEITVDSNGRFHAARFAFLSSSISGNFVSLVDGGRWDIESDATGDLLIEARAEAGGDKLGFFNAAPVVQPAVIPIADPAGSTAEDVANAFNLLLAALGQAKLGLIDDTP